MPLGVRDIRRLNRGLWAVQAGLILGTAGITGTALLNPPELATSVALDRAPSTQPTAQSTVAPLSWYAPIWTRDLRQPVMDPKPVVAEAAKPPPPPPPLKIKLLGTVIEDQDRYGLFAEVSGRLVVRRLQETIDEYTIVRIERGQAQLQGRGNPVWLTMPDYETRVAEGQR